MFLPSNLFNTVCNQPRHSRVGIIFFTALTVLDIAYLLFLKTQLSADGGKVLALRRRFALPIIIMFSMYRPSSYGWVGIEIDPYKATTVEGSLVRWQIRALSSAPSSMN